MTLYIANGVTVQGDDFIYVFNGLVFFGVDPDAGTTAAINGIAASSIASVSGVAIANIKSINGVE